MQISPIKYNTYFNYNYSSVAFRGDKLSLNSLRTLKGVKCIYCGEEMLTTGQIYDYANKASKLKGNNLAKFLIELQPKMKRNEKKVACLIKEELKKHPHADLKEILNILYPRHVELLEKQQEKVLLELQKIAVDFPEHDKNLTMEYINHGLEKIKNREEGQHFKRNKYISQFFMLNNKYKDFGNYIRIINAIKEMPNTHTSINAFVVKYSRKSSKEIATRLLQPSQITIEHLKPKSKGGTNELKNIVLACGHDNSKRRNESLETMRVGLSLNMSNYLQSLRKSAYKRFSKYENNKIEEYIKGIKDTINKLLLNDLQIYDPSKGIYFNA